MLHARPYSRRLAPPPDPARRLLIVRLLRWWDCRANPKSRVRLSQQCWFAFCAAMIRDVRALSNRCCERFLSGERAQILAAGTRAWGRCAQRVSKPLSQPTRARVTLAE